MISLLALLEAGYDIRNKFFLKYSFFISSLKSIYFYVVFVIV